MKLLIVGGVAAGMSAAARARRLSESAEIIVVEKSAHVSFANCGLPYHIGGEIKERDRLLLHTPESLRKMLNLDVRIRQEAIEIFPGSKRLRIRRLDSGEEYEESYDKLLLCPGAHPVKPSMPGVGGPGIFTLRNIEDMDAINTWIEKEKPASAVVSGAGYIGIEMAENLRLRGIEVDFVGKYAQTMPVFDPEMTKGFEQHLEANGVRLHLGSQAKAFHNDAGRILVELENGKKLPCQMVILSIGVRPDIQLAKDAGLAIGERGGISVDSSMRTSDPDIYAAGDAVEVKDFVSGTDALVPLAGPANRQGRTAADNILGRHSTYDSSLGTAIVKIFNMTAACVGLSEKSLRRLGISYKKIYLHPSSHAGYYPGATPLSMKLLFSPDDSRILGAQAVGFDGVDKRIDVLATAMKAGLTVFDLENLELSYAPPYGSAKDPVNMAGFIASNCLRGDLELWYPEDYPEKTRGAMIIDVRTEDSYKIAHIPSAVNIPMAKLRGEIDNIPRDKDIYLYCNVGYTSYLAYRMLVQSGRWKTRKLASLAGGITTFRNFHEIEPAPSKPHSTPNPSIAIGKGNQDMNKASSPEFVIDACGLQCPGPIMKLKDGAAKLAPGAIAKILASDPGFAADVKSWCENNGFELVSLSGSAPKIEAVIKKLDAVGTKACSIQPAGASDRSKSLTIVVFSGDLDKVLAAFVIANGALAMGKAVTMFFTFWGLNALRKDGPQAPGKSFMDSMFGMMMPKGPDHLKLSQMNMLGMGTEMMKSVMKGKKVASLPEMMDSAAAAGAKIIACSMSMDVMGLKKEELRDGIGIGGVATFLAEADKSGSTLFI